ncbi:MAG: 3-dehydroquinate synthase [Clostridia bacterium]|nr:3-dehydroquinate synthase [Clostridia bacterium]
MRTLHITASTEYDVLIGDDLLERCGALTAKVVKPCRCVVVTDSTVDALYGEAVTASYAHAGFEPVKFAFPAGEASKSLATLNELLNAMGAARLSRSDLVVALGGGVVGDLAGFAAAIYCRGTRFVQLPTTLLAAVDSSVGGKTAVDMPFGKNMVGAFHQPALVLTDTGVLRDLPALQRSNGAAEAIKCGVLNDPPLFALLEQGDWLDRVDEVVARCVDYKRDVVAGDEFDTGARAFLNLGHTFGHAIEACSKLTVLHGQAVGVGMLMAAAVADCPDALILRLAACLRTNGLPTHCDYGAAALAEAALSDKKRSGGTLTLVLPRAVGQCALRRIDVAELPGCFEKALARQEALGL